jgi:hypothetical protein
MPPLDMADMILPFLKNYYLTYLLIGKKLLNQQENHWKNHI